MRLIQQELTDDINSRINSVRRLMAEDGMDAILVASNANILYTTSRFFRGYVYIPAEGSPLWFVIRPDIYDHADNCVAIRKPEMIPSELIARGYAIPSKIGLEFDSLSYSDVSRLMAVFSEASFSNASKVLTRARMVKTPWEIEQIRIDGVHQAEAYRRITRCFKENMTDLEFQIEIERVLRLEGCLGTMRTAGNLMEINMGSVIAGANADVPSPYDFSMGGAGTDPSLPGGANGTTLKPGETVMIDMCGCFNAYQSDMTRVWRVGEIPHLAYKAHECSRNILRECEKMAVPGRPIADLYNMAAEIAAGEGLSDYFMGHRQHAAFIGHGVGIQLNEQPVIMPKSKDVCLENMVLAIEPKFVIPDVGAVGVENTYAVKSDGLECLTIFPEEIQEL